MKEKRREKKRAKEDRAEQKEREDERGGEESESTQYTRDRDSLSNCLSSPETPAAKASGYLEHHLYSWRADRRRYLPFSSSHTLILIFSFTISLHISLLHDGSLSTLHLVHVTLVISMFLLSSHSSLNIFFRELILLLSQVTLRARFVVAADGASSRIARLLSVVTTPPNAAAARSFVRV